MKVFCGDGTIKFPIVLLSLCIVLTVTCLLVMSWMVHVNQQQAKTYHQHQMRAIDLRYKVLHLDETLITAVHMAAFTGHEKWQQQYLLHLPELKEIRAIGYKIKPDFYATTIAKRIIAAKTRAIKTELTVFDWVNKQNLVKAQLLLRDEKYLQDKHLYRDIVNTIDSSPSLALKLKTLNGLIMFYDDVLTGSANLAAYTGNEYWFKRYQIYEPKLEDALNEVVRLLPDVFDGQSFIKTQQANNVLLGMERKAFRWIEEGDLLRAQALLASADYQKQKQVYARGMDSLAAMITLMVNEQNQLSFRKTSGALLLTLFLTVLLSLCWLVVFRYVRHWQRTYELAQEVLKDQNVFNLKQANHSLLEAQENAHTLQSQLIESNKMASLGAMSSGIAHEINQPLGTILLNAQMMDRLFEDMNEPGNLEKIRNNNSINIKQVLRVKKIMDALRTFSREDKFMLRERCDINQVVDEISMMLIEEFKISNINLNIQLTDRPMMTVFSSIQMGQVLTHLLANARDAVEFVENKQVDVSSYQQGTKAFIVVKDNGMGIAEENIHRIFEPFYTNKPIGKGTGLGLSLSYSMVKDNGGQITVNSTQGSGASFTVSFELAEAVNEGLTMDKVTMRQVE
ncbi:MAG: hypothetical protein HRU20_31310 [Pseudomonadales bacterium]|nr:hypothetical protein [Pseudomonadales bacterium]